MEKKERGKRENKGVMEGGVEVRVVLVGEFFSGSGMGKDLRGGREGW
jgi:hypothetical protein